MLSTWRDLVGLLTLEEAVLINKALRAKKVPHSLSVKHLTYIFRRRKALCILLTTVYNLPLPRETAQDIDIIIVRSLAAI